MTYLKTPSPTGCPWCFNIKEFMKKSKTIYYSAVTIGARQSLLTTTPLSVWVNNCVHVSAVKTVIVLLKTTEKTFSFTQMKIMIIHLAHVSLMRNKHILNGLLMKKLVLLILTWIFKSSFSQKIPITMCLFQVLSLIQELMLHMVMLNWLRILQ